MSVRIDPASLPADSNPDRHAAPTDGMPPERPLTAPQSPEPPSARVPRRDEPTQGRTEPRAEDSLQPSPEWRLGFGEPTPTSGWDPDIADVEGRIVVTWPRGRVPVVVWPDVIEGWAASINRGRAEVELLRGLLVDDEPRVHGLAEALITARDERRARGDYDDEEMQDVRVILRELRREAGLT